MAAFFEASNKTQGEILANPSLRRRFRPTVQSEDGEVPWYFPKERTSVAGHTAVEIADASGRLIEHAVVPAEPSELMKLDGTELQLIMEYDFIPSIVATAIHSAHLTMFWLMGYAHACSPSGKYMADILSQFFDRAHKLNGKARRKELEGYFAMHATMVKPLDSRSDPMLRGTVVDRRVIACVGASGIIFAVGVIVPFRDHRFVVFMPNDKAKELETYLGFLAEPPPSVMMKAFEYDPTGGIWRTSHSPPMQVPLTRDE